MGDVKKEIGLAVIGCGVVGRIRAKYAREYPGIGWLGLVVCGLWSCGCWQRGRR